MSDRYLMISADSHGGLRVRDYRDYLEAEYREDFDEWVSIFYEKVYNPNWKMFQAMMANGGEDQERMETLRDQVELGIGDASRRIDALEDDGWVATVVYTGVDFDTLPPFTSISFGGEHLHSSREQLWAGCRAFNRWMADYCSQYPGRLAGVVQIPDLDDVDEAVAEIEQAVAAGLFGGIQLPSLKRDQPPYGDPSFDRVWAACHELKMPVNCHAGTPKPDPRLFGDGPLADLLSATEQDFWMVRRPLGNFIFGGVFDRFPDVKLVFTEKNAYWIPAMVEELELAYGRAQRLRSDKRIELRPREYWMRNCGVGASFMTPKEAEMRQDIGVATIMYGSDFPHLEGTYPFTRESLRRSFAPVPRDELDAMLGGNAARIYRFDLDALRPIADRVGPRVDEVATPITELPRGFRDIDIEEMSGANA
jgi:predicted TIM-barrel fold metal-dependent hydrolase